MYFSIKLYNMHPMYVRELKDLKFFREAIDSLAVNSEPYNIVELKDFCASLLLITVILLTYFLFIACDNNLENKLILFLINFFDESTDSKALFSHEISKRK